jgi:hypothetical protein
MFVNGLGLDSLILSHKLISKTYSLLIYNKKISEKMAQDKTFIFNTVKEAKVDYVLKG